MYGENLHKIKLKRWGEIEMKREELLKIAKPILFKTFMIQAILDNKKTVTRRLIKLDLGLADTDKNDSSYLMIPDEYGDYHHAKDLCRYQAGDYLYVRETFQKLDKSIVTGLGDNEYAYVYKASENGRLWESETENWKWRPSIYMPKEAARIFLKVTNVRIERIQDITEHEAQAEGSEYYKDIDFSIGNTYISVFSHLWNSTIKKEVLYKYGWDANPWVWVIEFEKLEIEN